MTKEREKELRAWISEKPTLAKEFNELSVAHQCEALAEFDENSWSRTSDRLRENVKLLRAEEKQEDARAKLSRDLLGGVVGTPEDQKKVS